MCQHPCSQCRAFSEIRRTSGFVSELRRATFGSARTTLRRTTPSTTSAAARTRREMPVDLRGVVVGALCLVHVVGEVEHELDRFLVSVPRVVEVDIDLELDAVGD